MDVKLPQLAEGVESGTVVSILVSEGQEVKKDQAFMELETQKAVGSIPAPASGTVSKIHVREGTEVSVGQVLISISAEGAAPTATAATPIARPKEREAYPPRQQEKSDRGPVRIMDDYRYESRTGAPPAAAPTIRKISRELGIDLTRVKGSEAGGRIVLEDLRAYVQRLQQIAFEQRAPTAGVQARSESAEERQKEPVDFSRWGSVRRQKMSALRRTVSRRMVESWTTIPKINQFDDADITNLLALRKKHAPAYERKGARLTLTSFLLKIVTAALQKHPLANASVDETSNEIVFKDYFHIGVAVDTEAGLIVPVIRDVNKKNLLQLSQELFDVTEKAKQRRLSIEELQGGTFTISNQGSIGGSHFTPIIYAPQVAILGVGQGQAKPVVIDSKVAVRSMLPLCLAYDHRVLDGANAVRFMKDIIAGIESFAESDVRIK
ncbi:MAG TPA: dihydrolipoamide acetyltransferase family protein [Candidatus Udaeobacter sp.]|nr:dihydrolipoamide acetyltransferase family protein [Candidatus Udaeobacter sp.]